MRLKLAYAVSAVAIAGRSYSAFVHRAPRVPASYSTWRVSPSRWTGPASSKKHRSPFARSHELSTGARRCAATGDQDVFEDRSKPHSGRETRRNPSRASRVPEMAPKDVQEKDSSGGGDWVAGAKKLVMGIAFACTLLGSGSLVPPLGTNMAMAAQDPKEIGLCLLGQCQAELASCILNPKCFANIICLNTCNDRPDEAYCQIRCGDLFENEAVGKFNACAVSKKNCVKQRQDDGSWPVPPIESMVKAFDTKQMEGRWFISAGLNPAFDCFDCQVHFFNSPKPGKLVAKLNWRITEPDGEFFNRDVIQKFAQDPDNPAHLINKDNEYLHYRDDWYIIDAEKDSHVLVLYRGSNDAWDGYGGGTLYTRERDVPEELIPRLKERCKLAGIDWKRFRYNDNSCYLQDKETTERLREKYAKKLLVAGGQQLQEQLTAARAFAKQEVEGVESSALDALEALRVEYQGLEENLAEEAEKIEDDLARAFEAELEIFERTLVDEAETIKAEATRVEQKTEDALVGGQYNSRQATQALKRLEGKVTAGSP